MKKLPSFTEFMNHANFRADEGLCSNIRYICGDFIRNSFSDFLEYKNYSCSFPIGSDCYIEEGCTSTSICTYYNCRAAHTLYVGKQLELRKHLYKQFRVWSKSNG